MKILNLFLSIIILCTSLHAQVIPGITQNDTPDYRTLFGLVTISFLLDHSVQTYAINNKSSFKDNIADIDRWYGDREITSLSLVGLYGLSYLIDSPRLKLVSEKAILSAIVSVAASSALKEVFGRSRPYANKGAWHFNPFAFKEASRSLPSGHATATFAISTVFAEEIDNIYWKSFWYGSAILVGAARIYKNQHWASDVVSGSAIGYIVAKKTSSLINEKATPQFGVAFIKDKPLLSLSISF